MEKHLILLTVLDFCFEMTSGFEPVKCLKNDDYGQHPDNIYYCSDEQEPDCCHRDDTFACCEPESHRALIQQLQLWGGLGGIIACMVIAYLCYRSDPYICEGKTAKERCEDCCICLRPSKSDGEDIIMTQLDKRGFNRSQSYRVTSSDDDKNHTPSHKNGERGKADTVSTPVSERSVNASLTKMKMALESPPPEKYKCPVCHGPTPCNEMITKM